MKRSSSFICFLIALSSVFPDELLAQASQIVCGPVKCTSYAVNLSTEKITLLYRNKDGDRFGSLGAVEKWGNAQEQESVKLVTNAGIFSWNFTPLGLFISNGAQLSALNADTGHGNFYLKPNGVFLVSSGKASVVESSLASAFTNIDLAVQSGPLLLSKGNIHSEFRVNSENRTVRSGVGVDDEGRVVFAISDGPINFYEFAILFRDQLHCQNALYLDGFISKMYLPEIGRRQRGGNFAGIFVVLKKKPELN